MESRHKAELVDYVVDILKPLPDEKAWKWAEKNIKLTQDHGEYAGPLRTDLTPWIRDVIEWIARCPEITDVTLMWGSQMAKTLALMVNLKSPT